MIMEIGIQNLINEEVKKDKREKDVITSWRASRLGSCLRGMYYERLGMKPDTEFDDRKLRVFHCGKLFEEWVVGLIKKQEQYKVETQVRIEDKEINVSGYADLILEDKTGKMVYEIKSKNSQGFKYLEATSGQEQHRKQLWIYLYCLKIEKGNLLYLSKDDLRIAEYPVFLNDEELSKETLGEIELLNKAWKNKTPEILPLPEKGSFQDKFCNYHSHCAALELELLKNKIK
jgi:hypothetical protein